MYRLNYSKIFITSGREACAIVNSGWQQCVAVTDAAAAKNWLELQIKE